MRVWGPQVAHIMHSTPALLQGNLIAILKLFWSLLYLFCVVKLEASVAIQKRSVLTYLFGQNVPVFASSFQLNITLVD